MLQSPTFEYSNLVDFWHVCLTHFSADRCRACMQVREIDK